MHACHGTPADECVKGAPVKHAASALLNFDGGKRQLLLLLLLKGKGGMRPMRVAGWDVTAHLDLLKHLVFFLLHLGLDLFNFFSTNFPSRKALNFDSTIFQFEISTVIEFFELMGKFLYL